MAQKNMKIMIRKSYSELIEIPTFKERYRYLQLSGELGVSTFGFDRYLNQQFYKTRGWRSRRDDLIIRDDGLDLGVEGFEIGGYILLHHINPITMEDVKTHSWNLLDPENLIITSMNTHNAIHYGDESSLMSNPIERSKNDTKLW